MSTSGWEIPDEKTLCQINPTFRKTLDALDGEMFGLLDEWLVYQDLFGRDQERIDLFNETAPLFFGLLQYSMIDSVVAQICRLTDPPEVGSKIKHQAFYLRVAQFCRLADKPKMSGKETLCLRRVGILAKPTHPRVAKQLNKAAERIDTLCKPCRDWRNKKVSHLDLAVHIDAKNNPLELVRKNVQDAVDAIRAYLDEARKKLAAGEFYYDAVYERDAVRPLLTAMIEAIQYREISKDDPTKSALRSGKYGNLFAKLEDGLKSSDSENLPQQNEDTA